MNADRVNVSIITISKDDPKGLADTIASVDSQKFDDIEHILVLAGTSAQDVKLSNKKTKVVYDSPPGISNAFNAGLEISTGKWVQFLNGGDCFCSADSLEKMVWLSSDSVDAVCTFAQVNGKNFTLPRSRLIPGKHDLMYISHQASLFRRELFVQYGFFDPKIRIRMDLDWLIRLPKNIPYIFASIQTVNFDPNGVSSINVVRSSIEELKILFQHGECLLFVRVLFFTFPLRVVRRLYRRLCDRLFLQFHRLGKF